MSERSQTPSWTSPYRFVMALRLLRARKINLISIVGVMLGVASIIVVMAVMDGFQRELRAMIRGTLSDMIVELDPTVDTSYRDVKEAVESVDGVKAITLQKHAFGLIPVLTRGSDGARQNYIPTRIIGLLPEDEARVSRVMNSMQEAPGQPENPFELDVPDFIPDEMPRVVVSRWIARRVGRGLSLTIGERFNIVTFEEVKDENGSRYVANDRDVVISRIYTSGNSEYDKLHIYVDLSQTRSVFFNQPDATISELRVRINDDAFPPEVRAGIARTMERFDPSFAGMDPRYRIETWEERQRNLLRAVNNEKFLLAFVMFFIVLVACFSIFATLTMTVVEKTREIGVLRALGATGSGILSIFLINGTLVGIIGAGLGYGAGLYVADNANPIRNWLRDTFGWDIFPSDIYLFDEIPTYIDHTAALYFALAAAVSAMVFAIIPAVRAARLRPVKALRFE